MDLEIQGAGFFLMRTDFKGAWRSRMSENRDSKAMSLSLTSSNTSRIDRGSLDMSSLNSVTFRFLNDLRLMVFIGGLINFQEISRKIGRWSEMAESRVRDWDMRTSGDVKNMSMMELDWREKRVGSQMGWNKLYEVMKSDRVLQLGFVWIR